MASIFIFIDPLIAWQYVHARERRTKRDWSEEVHRLLDFHPQAKQVILVSDNLNTHVYGSFYERFEALEAFEHCQRLEILHTPIHGSLLNMAECELSVLKMRCLRRRRFATIELLRKPTTAWTIDRNQRTKKVDWRLTTPERS